MKKSIYEYVRNHCGADIHTVAKALNLDEIQVLRIINELIQESYIKVGPSIPLSTSNHNSCYYAAIGKAFAEK